MTQREFYLERRRAEIPVFMKVLKALPADLFERWSNELTDRVEKMDDASWNRVAKFYYNGKVVSPRVRPSTVLRATVRTWPDVEMDSRLGRARRRDAAIDIRRAEHVASGHSIRPL